MYGTTKEQGLQLPGHHHSEEAWESIIALKFESEIMERGKVIVL